MRMKAILAAAAFALASVGSGQAAAQDAARAELARELMGIMQIETLLSELFTQMAPMAATGMARDLSLSPSQEARLGELIAEEFRAATPGMVEEMARVYSELLSEEQLRETVAFRRTPSGALFIETQFLAQEELERIGAMAGMRAGLQALTRLQAEMSARQSERM